MGWCLTSRLHGGSDIATRQDDVVAGIEDRRALARAAFAHWGEAYGLALQFAGEREAAADLCQEAFLRLLTVRRLPDMRRPLRAYLLTVVRNLAYRGSRKPEGGGLKDAAAEASRSSPEADPPSEIERREEVDRLREAMAALPALWRATLYLREASGLSYREVAEVLDTSADVVRTTLHRARTRVRNALERGGLPGRPALSAPERTEERRS